MNGANDTPRSRPIESPKTTDTHRAKLAVVYVRQSTPQQVAENRESLARQDALADHARSLGWPTERVLVIDEDLGIRPHDGPNRGNLEWRPAGVSTVYRILTHPTYAGTYAYGRTPVEPKRRRRDHQAAGLA